MAPVSLEPGLAAFQCPKSGGCWLPLQAYFKWRDATPHAVSPLPEGYEPVVEHDTERAMLCPESGTLLQRYRVGHGLHFSINRSSVTGGVWLDAGEWDALKSKGLHEQLNLIFTAPYQRTIRSEELTHALRGAFEARMGAEDFARVEAFREWMLQHPEARYVLNYLIEAEKSAGKAG